MWLLLRYGILLAEMKFMSGEQYLIFGSPRDVIYNDYKLARHARPHPLLYAAVRSFRLFQVRVLITYLTMLNFIIHN